MAKPRVVNIQFNDEPVDFGQYAHHILAEGDSWFAWAHLNLKPSSNLLEQLQFGSSAVVVSCAYSGDVIRNMGDMASNALFANELRAARYDAILLSGGGNDLIDALETRAGVPGIIQARASGAPDAPASYVNQAALANLITDVQDGYRQIIAYRSTTINHATPVVLHTYDYPTARNAPATFLGGSAAGPWLLPAFAAAGVPIAQHERVTRLIYDRLAAALLSLDAPASHVHVVGTCGTIAPAQPNTAGLSGDWINEIHPDAHGYALLAEKLSARLQALGLP